MRIPPAHSPSFCVRKNTSLASMYSLQNLNSRTDDTMPKMIKTESNLTYRFAYLKVPLQHVLKTYASIAPLLRQREWCFTLSWYTYLSNGRISCFWAKSTRKSAKYSRYDPRSLNHVSTFMIPAFRSFRTHAPTFRWNNAGTWSKWRLFLWGKANNDFCLLIFERKSKSSF